MATKFGGSFSRRAPDRMTEELAMVFSGKGSFEFKPLFDIIYSNLRAQNSAGGGEEMCWLRAYEKLQSLVSQGVVKKTITNTIKKYKGVPAPLLALTLKLQAIRDEWVARAAA